MAPKIGNKDSGSSSEDEKGATAVSVVSKLQIPPFWEDACDVWFIAVETQFSTQRKLDDDDKYARIIGALPPTMIRTVMDIIKNPPQQHKYDALKNALVTRLTASAEKRLDDILSGLHTMGDLTPSQFYRLLAQTAGDTPLVTEDFLKNIWLKRLPDNLRAAVAGFSKKAIDDILPMADQIWVFAQPSTSQIAESSRHEPLSKATYGGQSDLAIIQQQLLQTQQQLQQTQQQQQQTQQQLQDLQRMMSNMDINRGRSPMRRNFYRNSSRSRSGSRSRRCYYHHRFGSQARRCNKPCDYKSGASNNVASNFSNNSEN